MLLAFHGQQAIKDKYLSRVEEHIRLDHLWQGGWYWAGSRGCAVGCTIEGNDHFAYERELGIPAEIAVLEDRIFESLPILRSKSWPIEFLSAIEPGADLSQIAETFTGKKWKFVFDINRCPDWLAGRAIERSGWVYKDIEFEADRLLELLKSAPVPSLIEEREEVGELVGV